MNKKERVKKYGSFLYCPKRNTLCMGQDYLGTGECKQTSCLLDDPEYRKKQQEREQRRKENWERAHREVAVKNRPRKYEYLEDEIKRKKQYMERCYRRGWTKMGDRISNEIAEMERRLKK